MLKTPSSLRVARGALLSSLAGVLAISVAAAASGSVRPAANVVEKSATVFGAKIRYLEAGAGPAVVLLHGLGGDSSNWAATIGPLSQKYRVIIPDQIGFGRSDKPMISYRVGTLVDFLDGLLKELKIERASLVGNSLGGWTAAAFTLAHPEKVDRLVLVDAAGFALAADWDGLPIRELNVATRAGLKRLIPLIFYDKEFYAKDEVVDLMFARKMTSGDGYTIQQFVESFIRKEDMLDNRLSAISKPTLIVWGRQDLLTPLAIGERFNREISGSKLLVIEKCGHVPQIEKAAEFSEALMRFLDGAR